MSASSSIFSTFEDEPIPKRKTFHDVLDELVGHYVNFQRSSPPEYLERRLLLEVGEDYIVTNHNGSGRIYTPIAHIVKITSI